MTAVEPEPAESGGSGGSGHAGLIAASLVLVLAMAMGFGLLLWAIAKAPTPQELTFTIPAGTDDRITMLEPVDVIPSQITIRRGGTITLVNLDDVTFQFGTLSVAPGQTVSKRFNDAGTFRNTCRLTPGQEVIITVT